MGEDPAREELLLAEQFEAHRARLRAVAHRMLGSAAEADDAVQEAWLRLHRSDEDAIDNLGAWLTTTVARVALDKLRAQHDADHEKARAAFAAALAKRLRLSEDKVKAALDALPHPGWRGHP